MKIIAPIFCFFFYLSVGDTLIYQNPSFDNCYTDTASCTVEYLPLVVENATWIMVSNTDVYAEITNYFAYKIEGDSMVNETPYKKVYHYELTPLDNSFEKFNIQERQFSTLIREDILERKIYNYPSRDEFGEILLEEYVLYDFSKQLNDTIYYWDDREGGFQTSVITSVEIEEHFGAFRRTLGTANGITIYEGIGYKNGLLEIPGAIILPVGGLSLLVNYCVGDNFSCNLLTNTTEPIGQEVGIFPNPTTDLIQIQLSQPLKASIQLKTVAGQTVSQTEFNGLNHEIRVRELPKGVYFLHLQAKEGYLVRKIIIQ